MDNNYLYEDNVSGEMFYVQADNRHDADIIAQRWFEEPMFIRVDSDERADQLGYDTY